MWTWGKRLQQQPDIHSCGHWEAQNAELSATFMRDLLQVTGAFTQTGGCSVNQPGQTCTSLSNGMTSGGSSSGSPTTPPSAPAPCSANLPLATQSAVLSAPIAPPAPPAPYVPSQGGPITGVQQTTSLGSTASCSGNQVGCNNGPTYVGQNNG